MLPITRRPLHPPVLVALALALCAASALGQGRLGSSVAGSARGVTGTTTMSGASTGTGAVGTASPVGVGNSTATGPLGATPTPSGQIPAATSPLPMGLPSPSGLTSGSAGALVAPGAPVPSGITSGTAGGSGVPGPSTPGSSVIGPDTTATVIGGSTRGVVVIPVPSEALPTGVMGGPGSLTNGVPSVSPMGAVTGPLTALQITQMFRQADSDGDGLLTRAEALRLPLVTMSFDDMDTNRDGVVSLSEYEASLQ